MKNGTVKGNILFWESLHLGILNGLRHRVGQPVEAACNGLAAVCQNREQKPQVLGSVCTYDMGHSVFRKSQLRVNLEKKRSGSSHFCFFYY